MTAQQDKAIDKLITEINGLRLDLSIYIAKQDERCAQCTKMVCDLNHEVNGDKNSAGINLELDRVRNRVNILWASLGTLAVIVAPVAISELIRLIKA